MAIRRRQNRARVTSSSAAASSPDQAPAGPWPCATAKPCRRRRPGPLPPETGCGTPSSVRVMSANPGAGRHTFRQGQPHRGEASGSKDRAPSHRHHHRSGHHRHPKQHAEEPAQAHPPPDGEREAKAGAHRAGTGVTGSRARRPRLSRRCESPSMRAQSMPPTQPRPYRRGPGPESLRGNGQQRKEEWPPGPATPATGTRARFRASRRRGKAEAFPQGTVEETVP